MLGVNLLRLRRILARWISETWFRRGLTQNADSPCIVSGQYNHLNALSTCVFAVRYLAYILLIRYFLPVLFIVRKKSDAKRSDTTTAGIGVALISEPLPPPFPIVTREVQIHPTPSLPSLPPVDDFRTSLILPECVIIML